MKKYIYTSPSSPPSLRPTRMEPPSYDSRVHGLTRLLGTSPPRSSPFPHPPPPSCLSSCPLVFLGHLLVSTLPPDRPAADRSKVISPWFVLDGSELVPAMAPFSSWPRGLVRECGLLVDLQLLHQCRALQTADPHTWPFSRPRLVAVVRE